MSTQSFVPSSEWTQEDRNRTILAIVAKMHEETRKRCPRREEVLDWAERIDKVVIESAPFLEDNRKRIVDDL